MKLAATFCLAVLSFAGCATEEVNSGGVYLYARSTKISSDPAGSIEAQNQLPGEPNGVQPAGILNIPDEIAPTEIVVEGVNPDFPIREVCRDCLVTFVHVPATNDSELGEIHVIGDGGMYLCTIFVDASGAQDTSDCTP